MNESASHSVLYPFILRYIALKQALGRGYAREKAILLSLDRFLTTAGEHDLDARNFAAWCRGKQHLSSGVLRDHMRIVRNLCRYRRRTESGCFVPDKHLFPDPHPPIRPYIFSYPQITCLLKAASDLPGASVSPIRAAVFRLAIVLLYTAGLRRGELLRLCVGDYDSHTRTLSIRETKFHSTRYLPLSANAAQELEDYLRLRRQHRLPLEADTPLIWNAQGGGRAYTDTTLRNVIRKLLAACEIRTAEGRLPRIHDLRHTFAVHALLRWYHLGLDLQAKLPLLAIYMGHVSIVSTEYYLHFVDDIAAVSSDRFAAHCAALVRPLSANGDVQ